ncbi:MULTISPECIES: hypothetical protein [Acinetobacter]|uniref:Uncharacterized protein n=1 Tax=Acinetobacter piscicola TaxID=2006115 RepID=A0A7S7AHK0_9GAMM|nr:MULTISPECIES: hypothetical protein [Acinetobacter]QOW45767.1 hypothetical protein G0028_07600 [Acinetobacter piscicola]QOW46039.1 hypothetical protein G0028_09115 [Acinetobacter piscicola]
MGFQTEVKMNPPLGKQPAHLISYFADNVAFTTYVKSSQITNRDGAIDKDEVTQILLDKHPIGTEILFYSVSDIGLQDVL